MANLRDSIGKEKIGDYIYKKALGKKNKQPDGSAKTSKEKGGK